MTLYLLGGAAPLALAGPPQEPVPTTARLVSFDDLQGRLAIDPVAQSTLAPTLPLELVQIDHTPVVQQTHGGGDQ